MEDKDAQEKAEKIVQYIYSLEETIKLMQESLVKITDLWQMSEKECKRLIQEKGESTWVIL